MSKVELVAFFDARKEVVAMVVISDPPEYATRVYQWWFRWFVRFLLLGNLVTFAISVSRNEQWWALTAYIFCWGLWLIRWNSKEMEDVYELLHLLEMNGRPIYVDDVSIEYSVGAEPPCKRQ